MIIPHVKEVSFVTPIVVPWSVEPIARFSVSKPEDVINTKPVQWGGVPQPFVVIRAEGADVYVPLANVAAIVSKA